MNSTADHLPDAGIRAWFESEAFAAYYCGRTDQEAAGFVDRILPVLGACRGDSALDACCGNGRHATALANRGLRVVGVDSSQAQITRAKTHTSAPVEFVRCDIEGFASSVQFDFAFNLHTSFGFDSEKTNLATLRVIHKHLQPKGQFVLDYWNSAHPKYRPLFGGQTVSRVRESEGMTFSTTASISGAFYTKNISVTRAGMATGFVERVMVISAATFRDYFRRCGFRILASFGSHELEPYDPKRSERLIFVVAKP